MIRTGKNRRECYKRNGIANVIKNKRNGIKFTLYLGFIR